MEILFQKLIVLLICATGIRSECNVCQRTNNVACHKENQYSLCINGVPTEDFITCPENYVCTPDPNVCYPQPEARPSCDQNWNLCDVCNKNKVYACVNETTIAFCYGNDRPLENADVSYCLGDTVCDIFSKDGFCTKRNFAKPSCIKNDNIVESIPIITTTEPATTTEEPTTAKPITTTTQLPATTTKELSVVESTASPTEPAATISEPTTTKLSSTTTEIPNTTTDSTTEERTITTTAPVVTKTEPTTTESQATITQPITTTAESTTAEFQATLTEHITTTAESTTAERTTMASEPETTTTETTTLEHIITTVKSATVEPIKTTTEATTTTAESKTTTTSTEVIPRDPNTICRDASTTGSFYADDPTCSTFVVCYITGGSIAGIKKSCKPGQYFPPGGKYCSTTKPDECI